MLEPSNSDETGKEKINLSDPKPPSEDRVKALVERMRERQSRNTLSRDGHDKVVKEWSPMNKENSMRGSHYYMQGLDGKTSLWNEMIVQLNPDHRKQITGLVFQDGTVVWSDEAVLHQHLINLAKKQGTGILCQFQSKYDSGQTKPLLLIYSNQPDVTKFSDYLRRNIDPRVALSVSVYPRIHSRGWEPYEISIKSS